MQKEKSIGRNILIVVLILVTIASVCAGLYAWAKYQTTINGTATGETAKWSFKVSDGNTSTQEIEFPMTRTDNNTSVAEGKIAPGTFGELEIGIDATGTETALTYVIEGTTENLPTNLKFYSDEERTLDLTVSDNKFSKGGYMKLNEVGVRNETIYWEWPFETGTSATVISKNDEIDMQDSSKTMSMKVSVTGKQLNSEPRLADLVQIGDYINYNASSNGTKTFTSTNLSSVVKDRPNPEDSDSAKYSGDISISATISTDDDFNSSEKAQWRVLNVDRNTGSIELISVNQTSKKVTLKGIKGYANAETVLNNIGAIYGQGQGAVSGRSLSLEDIEKYSKFDKNNYTNRIYSYSETKNQILKNPANRAENLNSKVIEKLTGSISDNPVLTQTFYSYTAKDYLPNMIYGMLFPNNMDSDCWVAATTIDLRESISNFCIECLYKRGKVDGKAVYNSDGWNYDYSGEETTTMGMYPIVELQNNIQTTGKDANGVWQLDV